MNDFKCPACAGTGLADEAAEEKQRARVEEAVAGVIDSDRRWRLAAEAVLGGVNVNGEPALDFVGRVVAFGEKVADV